MTTTPPPSTGNWLIGARGAVATTVVVGCAAIASGLRPPTGMVTLTPPFADCGLPALESLVFGGHDVVSCPLPKRAEQLAAEGVLPHDMTAAVRGGTRRGGSRGTRRGPGSGAICATTTN